jgi:radical SAM superfamily enzyme YgiQ (UPF0313 family)
MQTLLLALNWGKSVELGAMTRQAMALPLEFVYLSTELTRRNLDHTFVDCWAQDCALEDVAPAIAEADIVVLCSAPSYVFWRDGVINIGLVSRAISTVKRINPAVITILIGPHGTVVPEGFHGLPLDYLFRGEPDLLVPELIARLTAGDADVAQVPGVMTQHDGRLDGAPRGVEVADLNELAPMALDRFDISAYQHPRPYGAVSADRLSVLYEASRGCPYSCIYCFKVNFRDTFRAKSLDRIDAELRDLSERGVGYVYLIDEIFFKDPEWSAGVMRLLRKYDIRFGCQTRPVLLTAAMVDTIVEIGMAGLIQIGLEHTDTEVLKTMRKGDTNLAVLSASLHRLADAGIAIDLFLVTGLPGDTREKILAMSEVFETFPMRSINVISHGAMPLPGTRLWDIGNKGGHNLTSWDDVTRMRGMVGTEFSSSDDVDLAAFQLVGRLNAIEDRQVIQSGSGRPIHYLKWAKHSLDYHFPRVMRAATAARLRWSQ